MASNTVSAKVRLRPTRVALLVKPTDMASIRRFINVSTCMWGGFYNPIIPVFGRTPATWTEQLRQSTGYDVGRGYVEFFEPDVYVEAEPGIADKIGLGQMRQSGMIHRVIFGLDELLKPRDRDWAELAVGLEITDALSKIYETERRFTLRDERPAIRVPWPAAGFVDTEIRCLTELESGNAEKEVQPRVQT